MPSARPGRRQLKIGELERALGVTRDQVHHYVELGLVPPPTKSTATLAWYGPEHTAAIARVRAIRGAGGSLAQAQRWLTGELAKLGPMDCATLTRWIVGERTGGCAARLPVEAVVAMLDVGLARVDPDALVGGPALDPAPWLAELAERWAEREELARVTVAREVVSTAAGAVLTSWLPIESARVEGGALRAAVLDGVTPGVDADTEERARLGVMLPLPTPAAGLVGVGPWSTLARAMAAMRVRRWSDAAAELTSMAPGEPGSTLAAALAWCNDAMAAARAGDDVLDRVFSLAALRSIDAEAVDDLLERLRVRWTLAVTWLTLPRRWGGDRPERAISAVFDELARVAPDDPRRATGELAVVEANAGVARTAWRLREGDREGAFEAARQVVALGGAASRAAARLVRRTARPV